MRTISELEQKLVAGGGYEQENQISNISNGYAGNGWGEGGGAFGAMTGATQGATMSVVVVTGKRPNPALDTALVGAVGVAARGAGAAFVDGVIVGAEWGAAGGPWGIAAGILVGGIASYAAYKLLH